MSLESVDIGNEIKGDQGPKQGVAEEVKPIIRTSLTGPERRSIGTRKSISGPWHQGRIFLGILTRAMYVL